MIYCWRAIIELRTPLHCGGGEDNGFDQPVLRDAFGCYRIPGSTVAGVLLSYAKKLFPDNPTLISRAFGGGGTKGKEGYQDQPGKSSAIWCYDAPLLDFDHIPAAHKCACGDTPRIGLGPYIRDHVRIDDASGAAEQGGKFDEEFVPAGSRYGDPDIFGRITPRPPGAQ